MLDWAVRSETCSNAQRNSISYARIAANSECYNSTNGSGYHCNCSSRFQVNPYLLDGCQGTNLYLVYYMIFKLLVAVAKWAWKVLFIYLDGLHCVSDINECKTSKPCNETCHNFVGGFNCSCSKGYELVYKGNPIVQTGCRPTATVSQSSKIVIIALCKHIQSLTDTYMVS